LKLQPKKILRWPSGAAGKEEFEATANGSIPENKNGRPEMPKLTA